MCFLIWHDWSPWREIETANVMMGENKIGIVLSQKRSCYRCGYNQIDIKTRCV